MSESHPIFEHLPMELVSTGIFDQKILDPENSELKCVFFWGHNCPNCDVAKRSFVVNLEEIKKRPVKWYHVNVYNDFDLGTRFGLHGIPVFIFFRNAKNLGRITSFPGIDPFLEAVDRLLS